MLPVFPLDHGDEVATAVEDDASGGRGSLIDSDDKALGHYSPFMKPGWWGDGSPARGAEIAGNRAGGVADVCDKG